MSDDAIPETPSTPPPAPSTKTVLTAREKDIICFAFLSLDNANAKPDFNKMMALTGAKTIESTRVTWSNIRRKLANENLVVSAPTTPKTRKAATPRKRKSTAAEAKPKTSGDDGHVEDDKQQQQQADEEDHGKEDVKATPKKIRAKRGKSTPAKSPKAETKGKVAAEKEDCGDGDAKGKAEADGPDEKEDCVDEMEE